MKVDIIILNHNGENLMRSCLPSIIEAKSRSRFDVEIVVIDNASQDRSLEILKGYGDKISVIPHENNFLCSFNDVVATRDSDIVILLNNDIKVKGDFIEHLAGVFLAYPDVFLAAPKVLNFRGEEEGAFTLAKVRLGLFWSSALFDNWRDHVNKFSPTFSSGFGAFDRRKFLFLKGYDSLYLPGRFEDADICLRAWRRGWRCYYEPKSVVYHLGQVAFRERFGKKGIDAIDGRNIFLFMWKNFNTSLLMLNFLFLPLWFVWWLLRRDWHYPKGFFRALKRMPEILRARRETLGPGYIFNARKVFGFFSAWA